MHDDGEKGRVKILFMCWGYSIHARRRLQLFIDDPRFEVAVVSTYDYKFVNAAFYPLLAARKQAAVADETPLTKERKRLGWLSTEVREWLASLKRLVLLPQELYRSAGDYRTLRHAVRDFSPSLIFAQTLHYPSYLSYLLPRDIPMMVTFWNGDVTYFARWTGLEMLAKKWLVKFGLKRVQRITCNSQTAFDACIGLGAERSKMSLIRYPATDIDLFAQRDKSEARKQLNIDASNVVLCARGLGRFFNSDIIIESIPEVLKQFPDVLFLFVSGVGGSTEWVRHQERARELGVLDHIKWDGHIEWEQMPWYYSVSNVMLSIKTADSCPNCMLEAMAAEVPVVMSDTKQNREWIEDGVNGYLVDPRNPSLVAERLNSILGNANQLANAFSDISLQRVKEKGNAQINIPKIKKLVIELANENGYEDGR